MARDELRNWLAALSIGGGLLAGGVAEARDPSPPVERARPAPVEGGKSAPTRVEPAAARVRPAPVRKLGHYVVVNHEEQYGLWPAAVTPPGGWRQVGGAGELREGARRVKVADATQFKVVVNHEEQYGIWPADRSLPAGWRAEGEPCTLPDCLGRLDPPR